MPSWALVALAVRIGVACALVGAGAGCARSARPNVTPASPPQTSSFVAADVIADVKDFAVALGGHATDNFLRRSDRHTSDNRCYFTGRLQLPEFYSALHMIREDGERRAAARADNDGLPYSE